MTEGKCRHYYFGCFLIQFLSGVVVTICSGRHYLFTEIEWGISQNNNDDICLPFCLLFLIWGKSFPLCSFPPDPSQNSL